MKNNGFGLSILRPVRFLIAVFTCALVFFSSAFPAAAITSPTSHPEEATTQLLETQRLTDDISQQAPPGLQQVTEKSNEGLNEVQGAADIDKQKRPGNSQGATTVEDEVKGLLEKVTGTK